MTGVFGLLGERLSHSFSPMLHAMLADYEYRLFEKSPGELADFLQGDDFAGINVTIPYKKTVIPYCARLSPAAEKTQSVNTIIRQPDGRLYGDNTDYYGFSYLLDRTRADVSGKKAMILGSGGASMTVRTVLSDRGAGEVIIVSRNGETNYTNAAKHSDAYIIVNTTPVGMYPGNGARLIEPKDFPNCGAVIDIIYNPAKTELIMDAEDFGIPAYNGLHMLSAQAGRAAELFTGRAIADSEIDKITDKISRNTRNIVLIGMPGCGKSTIGKHLAELTGRELSDTDEMVVSDTGRSIESIFADSGENVFRGHESDALAAVSRESCRIIAAGGGIVKTPGNRRLIRQNSVAVFLERDVSELATDGRPLSRSRGVDALYNERLPLYRQWADVTVKVTDAYETARRIMELVL